MRVKSENQEKEVLTIKPITKKEMKTLVDAGILKNTHRGYVNKKGEPVGYYVSKNKRYIEDAYVDIANKI